MGDIRVKRCPFCDSSQHSVRWIGDMVQVCCEKCGATGGLGYNHRQAIDLWNSRLGPL